MTENGQQSTPSREQLIHAVKAKQRQIATLSQERDQLVATINQLDERVRKLEYQRDHAVVPSPRIIFPSIQSVRLNQPISTGICFGIGLIAAPFVLFLLAMAALICLSAGGFIGQNFYDVLGGPSP